MRPTNAFLSISVAQLHHHSVIGVFAAVCTLLCGVCLQGRARAEAPRNALADALIADLLVDAFTHILSHAEQDPPAKQSLPSSFHLPMTLTSKILRRLASHLASIRRERDVLLATVCTTSGESNI